MRPLHSNMVAKSAGIIEAVTKASVEWFESIKQYLADSINIDDRGKLSFNPITDNHGPLKESVLGSSFKEHAKLVRVVYGLAKKYLDIFPVT